MTLSIFLNNKHGLRNGWWVAFFFLVLASILFPVIMLSKYYKFNITIFHQSLIIVSTSIFCQWLRKEPLSNLFGVFNIQWIKELFIGGLTGMILMFTPALFLFAFCGVTWQKNTMDVLPLFSATMLFVGVAVVEEVLFRGFIFQRLMDGVGKWGAQLIIGGLFLLTHIGNPGMTGSIMVFACINIFLASLMFGLAYIKTKSLAMPIGLHFMANTIQGVVLGFGVSGLEQASFVKPIFTGTPDWLTGGSFGLEASLPGMISIIITTIVFYRWKYISHKNGITNPKVFSVSKITPHSK